MSVLSRLCDYEKSIRNIDRYLYEQSITDKIASEKNQKVQWSTTAISLLYPRLLAVHTAFAETTNIIGLVVILPFQIIGSVFINPPIKVARFMWWNSENIGKKLEELDNERTTCVSHKQIIKNIFCIHTLAVGVFSSLILGAVLNPTGNIWIQRGLGHIDAGKLKSIPEWKIKEKQEVAKETEDEVLGHLENVLVELESVGEEIKSNNGLPETELRDFVDFSSVPTAIEEASKVLQVEINETWGWTKYQKRIRLQKISLSDLVRTLKHFLRNKKYLDIDLTVKKLLEVKEALEKEHKDAWSKSTKTRLETCNRYIDQAISELKKVQEKLQQLSAQKQQN